MEKYSDFTFQDTNDGWQIEAWNESEEEVTILKVSWYELRDFVRRYYDYSKSEATLFLSRTTNDQDEDLLRLYFQEKFK